MNGKPLWPLLVGVLILGAMGFMQTDTSLKPKPKGPDMRRVFNGTFRARLDARRFGTLCRSLHDGLAMDWKQEKPHITTGAQVDNLRIIARRQQTGGKSYLELYPDLKAVLEAHFEEHVGKSGGPLTPETKTRWLSAFSELAEACDYAAGAL
jgi:hypothetical protein